ncbi:MAG: ferrous iron transporter B [Oscillospiraceae bacterium]|nr:ferrous iron transporter B [Oscillospiraceae bacterium]
MRRKRIQKLTVALAGNPNVGKSTLFNALTGLRQHTGNWPGKTVGTARGRCRRGGTEYCFVDLPGTYSLTGESEDERIAAEYIASGEADCTVVVCDGSSLERSLILALQILERAERVIVCVNLMDEAERRGIEVDAVKLSDCLGAPVVLTSAGQKRGLEELLDEIGHGEPSDGRHWPDPIPAAEEIAARCVRYSVDVSENWRKRLDEVLVSRRFGIPILLALLFGIIWITVWGANVPSELLEKLLDRGYDALKIWLADVPEWLSGVLVDGMYATSARVISVMLPPMAIFFPLFTILEDIGYLPRMAFLLDGKMCRCGGCGKQALTLCMGLGCNAVGVTGCRIIDSPRERLTAILTNAMVPCNGRFPTLILLGSLFFAGLGGALAVAGCVVLGVLGAMLSSGALSKTVLRHEQSTFLMEMPPFRKPRVGQILVRSLLDRTLHIALRALKVAAPAGALLWIFANTGLLGSAAAFLDPVGQALGMNGVILLAFLFSLPANELLIPVIMMALTGAGSLQGVSAAGGEILLNAGWDWKIAVCTMVFTLFHWPCATTLMTVHKETGSTAKTAAAFFLPTAIGVVLCLMLNLVLG